MSKLQFLLRFSCFFALVLVSCGQYSSRHQAEAQLDVLLDQHFARCGDTSAAVDKSRSLVQIKGLRLQWAPDSAGDPTEAEKLNGVEFSGLAWDSCSSYKIRDREWVSCPSFGKSDGLLIKYIGGTTCVEKKNGEWTVSSKIKELVPADCSKLSF